MNLSYDDFDRVAMRLRCEPEALMAVVRVETPSPHVGDSVHGPLILNERHWFYKLSGNYPVSRDYPELSSRTAGGYCKGSNWTARQDCEHRKLRQKMTIYNGACREAALMSVSMGLFQVMGFNHAIIGYHSVERMWEDALKKDDNIDLIWFVEFIKSRHLDDELRTKDWRSFARQYNGPAYSKNNYDTKLAENYTFFKNQNTQKEIKKTGRIDLHAMAPYPPVIMETGFPDFSQLYGIPA